MNEQNQTNLQNPIGKFFSSTLGRVTVTAVSACIIFGLIFIGLQSGAFVIFAITVIGCGYFGWKALNFITPKIFLIMPLIGWCIYFFIKGFLSVGIGAFVAPFQIGRMISRTAASITSDEE